MFARLTTLGVLFLILTFPAVSAGWQKNEPLPEEGMISLLELGIDDETIVARIEKAGLSFTLDDASIERLKKAGASEAVIEAARAAGAAKKPGGKPAAAPPVQYADVLKMLSLGLDEEAIVKRLAKSPTVFTLSAEQVAELKDAGASEKLIAALGEARAPSAQAAELITDLAIVFDCSGSMKEKTPEGETKMTAAKRVVANMVQSIPDGMNVTFVVYGHEAFGAEDDPRNCQAVKVARPLGPLDEQGRAELSQMIEGLRPTGTTPIARALKIAGAELQRNDPYCGLVLITDGLETCMGDPVAEAAKLARNPKLAFGVNVIGFGAKPEEDAALARIADAGGGKYYGADSSKELADALKVVSTELEKAATPPKKAPSPRRAIKVLKPAIEFPECEEIQVVSFGIGSSSVDAKGKYGEEIRIPSSTTKYEIRWVPKNGIGVAILKDFVLAERKVIEIKPEEHLGMIQVNGEGAPKEGIVVYQRGLGSIIRLQESKKFGEIMVVPAEKVNVEVDGEDIETELTVEAGTLHELE